VNIAPVSERSTTKGITHGQRWSPWNSACLGDEAGGGEHICSSVLLGQLVFRASIRAGCAEGSVRVRRTALWSW